MTGQADWRPVINGRKTDGCVEGLSAASYSFRRRTPCPAFFYPLSSAILPRLDGPPPGFDLAELIRARSGEHHALHRAHVNPVFESVLRTIGFDQVYERASGQYLWDRDDNRYLDFLGGYAVVNAGRNHPTIRKALHDLLALEHPSMVQFDAPLLAGVLAEELSRRTPNGLEHVFFTNSGTEGIEAAIKFAARRRAAAAPDARPISASSPRNSPPRSASLESWPLAARCAA